MQEQKMYNTEITQVKADSTMKVGDGGYRIRSENFLIRGFMCTGFCAYFVDSVRLTRKRGHSNQRKCQGPR